MIAAAYAANAVIPPPEEPAFHTRSHRVVIDSCHRDLERWPSPSCFSVDLTEPLLDVMSVRVIEARLPPAGPRNVRGGANEIDVEETDSVGTIVKRVWVRPGLYSGPALAAAFEASLRNVMSAADVSVTWDEPAGHCVIYTGMVTANGDRVVSRIVSPSDPVAYQRSLARVLGLARGEASQARQLLTDAMNTDLLEESSGVFRPASGGLGAGVRPGDRVVIFHQGPPSSGVVIHGDRIRVPGAQAAGLIVAATVWRADMRPDHRMPAVNKRPVLHLNGFRRIESPHDAYNAAFAVIDTDDGLCRDDLPTKHFNPPLHMINRLSVRLTDAWGDPYDLQNDDVQLELEVTRMMPGARASMTHFMAG